MILDLDASASSQGTGPVRVSWTEGGGWDMVEYQAVVIDGRPTDLRVRVLGQAVFLPIEDTCGFDMIWEAGHRALFEAQAKATGR